MTGGREAGDASSDDEELVIVVQVILLVCGPCHQMVTVRQRDKESVVVPSDILSVQLRAEGGCGPRQLSSGQDTPREGGTGLAWPDTSTLCVVRSDSAIYIDTEQS